MGELTGLPVRAAKTCQMATVTKLLFGWIAIGRKKRSNKKLATIWKSSTYVWFAQVRRNWFWVSWFDEFSLVSQRARAGLRAIACACYLNFLCGKNWSNTLRVSWFDEFLVTVEQMRSHTLRWLDFLCAVQKLVKPQHSRNCVLLFVIWPVACQLSFLRLL